MEPKPSYKSVEGQSLFGITGACIYFLYSILSGDGNSDVPVEDILKHAESAKEIAEAYVSGGTELSELADVGKSGVIFWFLYKAYAKFVDSRTEIKKAINYV